MRDTPLFNGQSDEIKLEDIDYVDSRASPHESEDENRQSVKIDER